MKAREELPKLPQARKYLRAATWGFETMMREKINDAHFVFQVIGIFAALRAVQHALRNRERKLSAQHKAVIDAWWQANDPKAISELRFIKTSRDLLLKEGAFESHAIHTEFAIGEGSNRQVTRVTYELVYYADGKRRNLVKDIRSALKWCDRELKKIEAQLPLRYPLRCHHQ